MINDPEGNGGHESSSHITEVDIVGRPAVVHSPNLALVFTPIVAFILTFDSKSSSHITTMDFFFSHQSAKVLIASHRDLVSSAIIRKLQQFGFTNLILWTHTELSLTRWEDVAQADYFSCKFWGETQSFWEKKKFLVQRRRPVSWRSRWRRWKLCMITRVASLVLPKWMKS